ncbi:hypothetical protein [Turneriella parva]|uniref:DUF4365 domain-containing protein n=1 Tax=Turneriella parva (strain ATCC BAA-1111 / DSM 21527 / NCTC 11395 / H) TaxID=869212 RepID=I4B1Q6_TURPD|nr:hypothetical protein [Turneriella parva]AFM11213.1 hypothetical protein Turpa_0561 [Turneriella parva DSM 21527]
MNSSQIEQRGIHALRDLILKSNILASEILENDRHPHWDGHILVYKQPRLKAGDLHGRIPVQVKSTNGRLKQSITRDRLEVYLRDGGLLFFMVQLGDLPKIYLSFLLPMDIRKYMQKNQKSYALNFQLVSDALHLESICYFFLQNKQLQVGTDRSISIKDLAGKQTDMVLSFMPERNFIENFAKGNFYVYADLGKNLTVPCHLDDGLLALSGPAQVVVAEKTYFSSASLVRNSIGETRLFLNNALEVKINRDKSLTIALNVDGTASIPANLADLFAALEFMEALLVHKRLKLNGRDLAVSMPKMADTFDRNIAWAKTHRQLFDILQIDYSHVSFKDYDQNKDQANVIRILIATLLNGEKAVLQVERPLFIQRFRIFHQDILIKFERQKDNHFVLHDFNAPFPNEDTLEVKQRDQTGADIKFRISKYLLLNNTDLIRGVGRITNQVAASLREYFDPMAQDIYAQFMLLCIHVYDQDASEQFLSLAEDICSLLTHKGILDPLTSEVNQLQIVRRRRAFTPREIRRMGEIISDSKSENDVICCLHILLEEYAEFEQLFLKMTEDRQTTFRKWPIYTLYVQWKQKNQGG